MKGFRAATTLGLFHSFGCYCGKSGPSLCESGMWESSRGCFVR
jgi:hypothetical protein